MTNRLSVGGSMTGPVIQSGGSVRVTGGISVSVGTLTGLADHIDKVRTLLDTHAELVPRHAVTDLGLAQIASQAREPQPATPTVIGRLWNDLRPELAELASTIGELSGLVPHLAAITDSVAALDAD